MTILQKELNYLKNTEAQFRILEMALLKAKSKGLKTINIKELWKNKKLNKSGTK